jgi:hypothetical protein
VALNTTSLLVRLQYQFGLGGEWCDASIQDQSDSKNRGDIIESNRGLANNQDGGY